ncbi:hypothetical protein M569_03527, partial [Genlisea aurea]
KIGAILLGSFILFACTNPRPAAARPFLGEVKLEEKSNAHFEEKKGDEDEQETMCVQAFEGDPTNLETLKMVVNVKMRKGKTKEAVEYVEKLIRLQPNEMEWRLLQAFCYELIGDLSRAKSLFKDILKQNPLLLRALHGLAMVMHKKLEGPAVFQMLDKAVELARVEKRVNEERSIVILIAQMHILKGELEEALSKLQSLVADNPRDFRPYLCQGIVYGLLGKSKEADESFEIYRSLVPEEFPQKSYLDHVYLAARTK